MKLITQCFLEKTKEQHNTKQTHTVIKKTHWANKVKNKKTKNKQYKGTHRKKENGN